MSERVVALGELRSRPKVRWGCFRCKVTMRHVEEGQVIVSPTGCAHFGIEGETRCGIDATGGKWWWPL